MCSSCQSLWEGEQCQQQTHFYVWHPEELFCQTDTNVAQKLQIDYSRMVGLVDKRGGAEVFCAWADWGCPWAHLDRLKEWAAEGAVEWYQVILESFEEVEARAPDAARGHALTSFINEATF